MWSSELERGEVVELGSLGGGWLVGCSSEVAAVLWLVGRLGRKAVLRPTSSLIYLYSSTSISRARNKQRHDTTREHTNSNGGSRRS